MKTRLLLAGASVVAMSALAACGGGDGESSDTKYKIALFSQVDVDLAHEGLDAFQKEFLSKAGLEASDVEWVEKNAQGDSARCQTIARELADSDLDGAAIIGTPCIIAMATVDKETPIFTIAVSDPVGAKVAESVAEPGMNVTGSTRGTDAAPFLDEVLKVTPTAESIGIVYDQANPSVTGWVDSLEAAADAAGLTFVGKSVTSADQIPAVVRSVVPQVDAMIIAPDGLLATAAPVVASTAQRAQVPVYTSGIGRTDVPGIVAEIGPTFTDMGEAAADIAVRVIVDGEDPGSIAFAEPIKLLWTVNEGSIEATGITVPADILASATKVG